MIKREINESPVTQGVHERISYTIDTTPWGGSPSAVSVTVYNYSTRSTEDEFNVTDTVMPTNEPTVDEDTITLSPLYSLTAGIRYRITIQWSNAGNTFETYAYIDAEL